MTTFLFWNINRKPLEKLVRLLIDDHAPDILLLAECETPIDVLLLAINSSNALIYHLSAEPPAMLLPNRVLTLSRLPRSAVRALMGNSEVAIRRIKPLFGDELLLLGMHLSSKSNLDSREQAFYATRLRTLIATAESKAKHERTVVMGDLNMDPFEDGVTGSESLHAVMDKRIAMKRARVVKREKRLFFYNPMWSRMGDNSSGPPGTYYFAASGPMANYWYTYDQVLIRPDLLPNFKEEDLAVLVSAGTVSLLTAAGIPNTRIASDHLPLLFKI